MSTMTDHVDVDSDGRMSSTVSRPNGQDQDNVRVLHILHWPFTKGTRRWAFNTDIIKLSPIGDGEKPGSVNEYYCTQIEKSLGRIPNPEALELYQENFSWQNRTLVKIRNVREKDGLKRADYFMYVCLDEKVGLDQNSLLSKLVRDFKVYEGAFLFKTATDSGDSKHAVYLQCSDEDFNTDEKVEYFSEQGILRDLMLALKWRDCDGDKVGVESAPSPQRAFD